VLDGLDNSKPTEGLVARPIPGRGRGIGLINKLQTQNRKKKYKEG
jgi:hypothetical protein